MDCRKLPSLTTRQIITKFGKGFAPLYEILNEMGQVSAVTEPVFETSSGNENFCQIFRDIGLYHWEICNENAEKRLKMNLRRFMQTIDRAFLYSIRGVAQPDYRPPRRCMCGMAQWLNKNQRVFQLNITAVTKQFDEVVKKNFGSLDGKLVLCGKRIFKELVVNNLFLDKMCADWDYFILDPLKLGYRYVSNEEREMGECPYSGKLDIGFFKTNYYHHPEYEILAELGLDFESPESHLWVRGN